MNNPPWRDWDEWTVADAYLAGFGVGVKVSDATPYLRITQLYLTVSYEMPPYYFELANDIDASDTVTWNWDDTFLEYFGFDPIGDSSNRFTGSFDGNGYSITGLFINRSSYVGLFGYTEGATIQNVNLADVDILGGDQVGALIGQVYGDPTPCTIANCHVSGNVSGAMWVGGLIGYSFSADISNCSSSAIVTGSSTNVGGLIGHFNGEGTGTVTESHATGAVTGFYAVGGLVGLYAAAATSQCFATGNVEADTLVGGFIGQANSGTMSDCYARGAVTALGETWPGTASGFVDYNWATITNSYSTGLVAGDTSAGFSGDNSGTITNSFWDTQTSGQAASDGGTGKTTAEMKTIGTFSAWDIALTEVAALNDGYPFLSWQIGNSPTWVISLPGSMFSDINQVVHFQPNTIILGTTLPNRAGGGGVYPNGTFSWGDNPAGIEIRLDGFLQPEDVYRFEPIMPGGWDIIEPEPGGMTGDVDLGKLAKNPFRPMVQVIASGAGFTERLAWLLLAIFILIAIMIAVLLWTQHMVFTALAGFAVGFMFYSMGVWGLWVVILLAFGLVASIVYERMPTL